jgi:hypothetical protein
MWPIRFHTYSDTLHVTRRPYFPKRFGPWESRVRVGWEGCKRTFYAARPRSRTDAFICANSCAWLGTLVSPGTIPANPTFLLLGFPRIQIGWPPEQNTESLMIWKVQQARLHIYIPPSHDLDWRFSVLQTLFLSRYPYEEGRPFQAVLSIWPPTLTSLLLLKSVRRCECPAWWLSSFC